MIHAAAERHGVNAGLVAALVRAESAFDPYAVSHKGARGLMQLMPATAKRFGVREHQIFEPDRNLEAGTRYLRWLLDRFDGDVVRALAAYNAGEGTVERYGGVPPFRETRDYIRRIYASLGVPEALLEDGSGGVAAGAAAGAAASPALR
jgi:soluble lytic murein transglycosylase-like protein